MLTKEGSSSEMGYIKLEVIEEEKNKNLAVHFSAHAYTCTHKRKFMHTQTEIQYVTHHLTHLLVPPMITACQDFGKKSRSCALQDFPFCKDCELPTLWRKPSAHRIFTTSHPTSMSFLANLHSTLRSIAILFLCLDSHLPFHSPGW